MSLLSCGQSRRVAGPHWTFRLLCVLLLCTTGSAASAQILSKVLGGTADTLKQTTTTVKQTTTAVAQTTGGLTQNLLGTVVPVAVTASGNHAEIRIGSAGLPFAEVTLDFQDASGLSPSSLGASARLIDLADSALLGRLPDLGLTPLTDTLQVLISIEPPANGGLSFRDTGRMEIHTHLLPYSIGSSYRVFKASLGEPFRDVTDEIAKGSVRARTTYGGFSQFLILLDLRPTGLVIQEKIWWLRAQAATVPSAERPALFALLDQVDTAVAAADYNGAIATIDAFRAHVQARAGVSIPNEWQPLGTIQNPLAQNPAGQLVAGANTLRFSVAYLRDFGQ